MDTGTSTARRIVLIVAAAVSCLGLAACGGHDGGGVKPPTGTPVTPPSVASINITGGELTLAPGSTGTLTAQALDAKGNVIDSTFSWHSSSDAIATVDGGVVTAVSVGQASITASAGGMTSTATLVVVNPSQTAEQAIAAALAAGQLSDEQALVYRVFAAFNDPRLPVNFRETSDQTPRNHDLLMLDVLSQFSALSDDSQLLIGPYLVPPSYQPATPVTSAAAMKRVLRPAGTHPRQGFCSGTISGDWVSKDTAHFRVWYNGKTQPGQAASAGAVGGYAETAYATLLGRGFQAPVPDSDWACDGGDARTDIYLLEEDLPGFLALTVPDIPLVGDSVADGSTASAYILIGASTLGKDIKGTVAHEFMHVIQFSYPNLGLRNYRWTLDATADWAIDVVWPDPPDLENTLSIANFLQLVYQPLFYPNAYCSKSGACADPDDDLKMYGAHAFFQFVSDQSGPNAVSQFFANAVNSDNPLDELNFVLSGQGGLTQVWPKFALQLWNQDPLPKGGIFKDWDGEMFWDGYISSSRSISGDQLPAQFEGPARFTNGASSPVKVNELSAIYDVFEFSNDVHSVVFYNGFSSRMTLLNFGIIGDIDYQTTKTFEGGQVLANFKATDEQIKGRHIWALKQINNAWLPPEDWTDVLVQPICLDAAAQRVQKLLLIYSNGNYTTSRTDSFDANALDHIGDQNTQLTASKTPCWKYQGTSTGVLTHDDGVDAFTIATSTTATYLGEPKFQEANVSSGHVTVFSGWSFAADPATVQFTASAVGTIRSCTPTYQLDQVDHEGVEFFNGPPNFYSWVAPQASALYNTYSGIGNQSIQYFIANCNGSAIKTLPAVNSINFNLDFTSLQHIDLEVGKLDSGAVGLPSPVWHPGDYGSDPGTVTNTWCLQALRENPQTPPATVCL